MSAFPTPSPLTLRRTSFLLAKKVRGLFSLVFVWEKETGRIGWGARLFNALRLPPPHVALKFPDRERRAGMEKIGNARNLLGNRERAKASVQPKNGNLRSKGMGNPEIRSDS